MMDEIEKRKDEMWKAYEEYREQIMKAARDPFYVHRGGVDLVWVEYDEHIEVKYGEPGIVPTYGNEVARVRLPAYYFVSYVDLDRAVREAINEWELYEDLAEAADEVVE